MANVACRRCGLEFPSFSHLRHGLCSKCKKINADGNDVPLSKIIVTTENDVSLPVAERLGIISAECVLGMHMFKDIVTSFSDVFGGRSKTMQMELRRARQSVIDELKQEAFALGANAVVAVRLDYNEISGGGKSMLFLVASGTAVRVIDHSQDESNPAS
jgi:uncharacterized protein YbjQ (UPF0145 family)